MDCFSIDGKIYCDLLKNGLYWLSSDCERINSLNVFPVPDGDTGYNMKITLEGGVNAGKEANKTEIGDASKLIARAMMMSARGNSGVILSQFFKGVSTAFEGFESVSVNQFANAMIEGAKKAYSVVQNPVEGTILTVMREAGEYSLKDLRINASLEDYLKLYLYQANKSLANTKEILPVLKKADVIDSGGAGFTLIIEGVLKYVQGINLSDEGFLKESKDIGSSKINFNNVRIDLYKMDFLLQLQQTKVDCKNFEVKEISQYLSSLGNSLVISRDEDIIKVHMETQDPGSIISYLRKYGEFIEVKIVNLKGCNIKKLDIPHKKYGVVAVACGVGIVKSFKELGTDIVLEGGQTMNTSTQEFIEAFNQLNCDNIFVYPNNANIVLAAKIAAQNYSKSKVHIFKTKTIVEGYSAISMLNFDGENLEEIIDSQEQTIGHVNTLQVTYAIRDTNMDEVKISKGDFICIYNGQIISSDSVRLNALKMGFNKIKNFEDVQVMTMFYGEDVESKEVEAIRNMALNRNKYMEVYPVEGKQPIYSLIIGLE